MTSPEAVPLRLEVPDAAFQLSPQDRVGLAPVFDGDALERLLREIRPEMRGEILAYFQKGKPASRGHLVQIFDPHLQTILEEVWAPFWENAPDQALDEDWYGMPGREIAQTRRAAARARAQQQPPRP